MYKHSFGILLMLVVQCGLLLSLFAANTNVSDISHHKAQYCSHSCNSILIEVEEEDFTDKTTYTRVQLLNKIQTQNIFPFHESIAAFNYKSPLLYLSDNFIYIRTCRLLI